MIRGTSGSYFYVCSANVTNLVRAAGPGEYIVGGVPATIGRYENNNNSAGWTLAVVYGNSALDVRNLNLFVGAEMVNSEGSAPGVVSGFCTPTAGPVNARVTATSIEGDARITGDGMRFGPTVGTMQSISGPRNPVSNFFSGQINNDTGNLDTTGTPGTPNHTPTNTGASLVSGARHSWDITSVDVSALMQNNQSSASVQGITTTGGSANDQYIMTGMGLQIDVGAPLAPVPNLTVDHSSTTVGETMTFSTTFSNATGHADALNVLYTSRPPFGLSFVPGSVTINGVTQSTADPRTGVYIGQLAVGTSVTVTYQFHVDAVPNPPLTAVYKVSGEWEYRFASCPGYPLNESSGSAGEVETSVPRLLPTKTAGDISAYEPGDTVTYTIEVPNSGTAASSGTTLRDPLESYLDYVPNSTRLNGVPVPDIAGGFPYTGPQLINSPGEAAGVIAAGDTATITFDVTVNPGAAAVIQNVAYTDPDGPGENHPEIPASTENPRLEADLSVTKTDGRTSMLAGETTTYTMTVTNLGPDTTTAMTVSDALPSTLLNPVFTASEGNYDPVTGIWTGLNLAQGQSVTLELQVQASGNIDGSVTNTVGVHGAPGVTYDPDTSNNQATDTNTISRQADLSVTKNNGADYLPVGGEVEYVVVLTNHGPSTIDSCFGIDTLPPEMTLIEYVPLIGYINMDTGMWTGLNLMAGEEARMLVRAQLDPDFAGGQVTNTVEIIPSGDYVDPDLSNNIATDTDTVTGDPLYRVEGMVYWDENHDGQRDPGEGGLGAYDLWMKKSVGGVGTGTVPVHNTTGEFVFPYVYPTTGQILVDDNNDQADQTPSLPPGWIDVNPPDATRTVTIANADVYNLDYGLWYGDRVSGQVFEDNGAGGGVYGDGIRNGSEAPLANVSISGYSAQGTVFETVVTDANGQYTLWIPGLYADQPLTITQANLPGYISVSGTPGNTGGTYDLATDSMTYVTHAGGIYTGVNFGDVQARTIAGWVYNDLNHNGQRDDGEAGLGLPGLYGKGMPDGATAAVQVIPVDPATGRVITSVAPGTYTVLVDNNNDPNDITPYAPPGWVPTEAPTQMITGIVVSTESVDNLNVGFYRGMKVTGRVFEDDGAGAGGIGNNGVQDGDEAGLELVTITAYDSGGTVLATTQSQALGDWELWVPYTAVSAEITIVETNPVAYLSTGGEAGDTGGTYDRATDTLTMTAVWGTEYEGVTFADVRAPTIEPDGQKLAGPGALVYYPHTFTASSAGTVTFGVSKVDNPTNPVWPEVLIYRDVNGDGQLDGGDTVLTGPVTVARGDEVKILAVVYVPIEAPLGASSLATVTADFAFSNADPALNWQGQVRDLTTVSEGAGVVLQKAADKETASPGEVITYTLTYTNNGLEAITDLVLLDKTPAYTTFVAAPVPTAAELPATLTGCTLTMPTAGEAGEMTWAFAGTLEPGSSGTVTYQVRVNSATP